MICVCDRVLIECRRCDKTVCLECDTHSRCAQCQYHPVCDEKIPVCDWCIRLYPYHFITEHVAVGNRRSPYYPFQIIVDLNCPHNGIKPGDCDLVKKGRKFIIKIGMLDCDNEQYATIARDYFEAIHAIIAKLKSKLDQPRILFHCYAGISRSVSAAAFYLSTSMDGVSGLRALEMIQEKRKIAKPNPLFQAILNEIV